MQRQMIVKRNVMILTKDFILNHHECLEFKHYSIIPNDEYNKLLQFGNKDLLHKLNSNRMIIKHSLKLDEISKLSNISYGEIYILTEESNQQRFIADKRIKLISIEKARKINRKEAVSQRISSFATVTILVFLVILSIYSGIVSNQAYFFNFLINNQWLKYMIVLIGLLLYIIRCRFKLAYGLIELTFSVSYVITNLSLLGGLYVIVRGLDNTYQGIKNRHDEFTIKCKKIWDKIFYGKKTS